MKLRIFFFAAVLGSLVYSCDKVTKPYPSNPSSSLDWTLFPGGDSTDYIANYWPEFTANTNTLRNVLIEDFTGHRCVYCPAQTAFMENLIATNPTRIFGVGIHSGPLGLGDLQAVDDRHPTIFYNPQGLEIGAYFGSVAGSSFIGNPAFTVNRIIRNSQYTSSAGSITTPTNQQLASTLKVNIQAKTNYFESTRGLFLHTEVEKLDNSIANDLKLVVYVIQDSLVSPQTLQNADDPDGSPSNPNTPDGISEDYVHHDIMRGCIDGRAFGRVLTTANLDVNGKYYLNYAYRVPDDLDAAHMHLIIYVMDSSTLEVYQVIKHELE